MEGEFGEELREKEERGRDPVWWSESLWFWWMVVGGCLIVTLDSW